MDKIEMSLKELKEYIAKTNKIAETNFILENENIFSGPVILYDKIQDKRVYFSFPSHVYTFLRGIIYMVNINRGV